MAESVGGDIPKDSEQIAADQHVVTDAQRKANYAMHRQIASKVLEKVVEPGLVQANRDQLESNFEARRQAALQAREQDRSYLAPKPKNKPWWKFW